STACRRHSAASPRSPRTPLEREVRGHRGWNPGIHLPGPNHLENRVSHMSASAARCCLPCLARRQLSIEEPDDLGIHHLVHRIAIEAFRILRGLPGEEFKCPRETRDEREMPGPF